MDFLNTHLKALIFALFFCLCASLVSAQDSSDLRAEQAVELYDSGRYAEARELLEGLAADGLATGPLLYRLSFTRRITGDRSGEQTARIDALNKLSEENQSATRLEIPFYLANALRNDGRPEEAKQVAAQATSKFEAGGFPKPESGIEWFRLAKLYQDQRRLDDAAKYYQSAIDAFDEGTFPANRAWAHRFIGDLAYSRQQWDKATQHFDALVQASPNPLRDDYNRQGAAHARQGNYEAAATAWEQAYRANPADGTEANYRWKLASQASAIKPLPLVSNYGRPWDELGKEELEAIMSGSVDDAKALIEAYNAAKEADPNTTPTDVQKAQLAARHKEFIAASMNYTLRNFPLRETAFTSGFAPFIFHANRWQFEVQKPRRKFMNRKKRANSDSQ